MNSTPRNVMEKILKLFLSFYYKCIFHKECVFQLTKSKLALFLGDSKITVMLRKEGKYVEKNNLLTKFKTNNEGAERVCVCM